MASPRHSESSPYPEALVARLDAPVRGRLSATLAPRAMGYLSVRVTFHRAPCIGIKVSFSEASSEDGVVGRPIGGELTTDRDGVARLDFLVPAGHYGCKVQNQRLTTVPTVPDDLVPFPVLTPIGRPYFDIGESREFDRSRHEIPAEERHVDADDAVDTEEE